jgi:uncharacterized membrane protein YcaP (DUF421 family)
MDLVLRATIVFFLIFVLTRVVGRRELNSLEPFDLIMLIVIGVIAVLTVFMSLLDFKFPALRPWLGGEPLVLLEDGEPIQRNLRRQRITVEELAAQARLQQIAHLRDVQFAVLETSGEISFIEKKS